MIRRIAVLGVLSITLVGCHWHQEPNTDYVCLLDTSKSIERESTVAEFKAMESLVDRLKRGDAVTLIPIVGNALADSSGRIIHLAVPTQRQPYDHDLVAFRDHARQQIKAMRDQALASPSSRTDILGALDAARQELALLPKQNNRRLLIVSDFIEDDGTFDFVSAAPLASPIRARFLAARLREQHGFTLPGIRLCLGRLESRDFRPLSPQRKGAVQAFWSTYLSDSRNVAEIRFDGTEMLADPEQGCLGVEK
jgi:hypothetical protein